MIGLAMFPPVPPNFIVELPFGGRPCAVSMLPVNIETGGKGCIAKKDEGQNLDVGFEASQLELATYIPSTVCKRPRHPNRCKAHEVLTDVTAKKY